MPFRMAFVVIALAVASLSSATTVIPPTFEELVRQADVVFEAEVFDTKSRISAERDGDPIVTDVYFRVTKVLKGTSGPVTVLEFLGGVVGDRGYRIDGVPTFAKGDRDVIFAIASRKLISPLVAMMHGRVRIATDPATRQDLVRRFDGTPLREVASMGLSEAGAAFSQAPSMTLTSFESAVLGEVSRQGGRAR